MFAHIAQIFGQSHSNSGHQVTLSDLTSENFIDTDWMIALKHLEIDMTNSTYRIYTSQNLDIGDLMSGQLCALSIINQWEKKGASLGHKPF